MSEGNTVIEKKTENNTKIMKKEKLNKLCELDAKLNNTKLVSQNRTEIKDFSGSDATITNKLIDKPVELDNDNNGQCKTIPDIEIYYESNKSKYWIKNPRDQWLAVNESHIRRKLRALGFYHKTNKGENVSQVDDKLIKIVSENNVDFAGIIAGYKTGLLKEKGTRILITRGPDLINPIKGNWDTVKVLLESLFLGHNQIDYIYGWLKTSVVALNDSEFGVGQAIVIAGPRACGKSFFQNHIVTPLLGGRSALPFRYLSEKSEFNSELIGSESLIVGDEVPCSDFAKRKKFGAKIKDIVANENQSAHAKGKDAFKVKPFWRLTISLNDEPENLMILPPLEDSLEDKISLFKTSRASNLPDQNNRAIFRKKIESELPAFMYYLLKEHTITEEFKCPDKRFGVKYFHHPEILEELSCLDPELKLHQIIQAVLFQDSKKNQWDGKSIDLENVLRSSNYEYEAQNLLSNYNACGRYLGRLKKRFHEQNLYSSRKIRGITFWTIKLENDSII